KLVPPDESTESEHRIGAERPGPRRRYVKSLDLRTLIRGTDDVSFGINSAVVDNKPRPSCSVLSIERVRRLEPGPGESQIQVDGVGLGDLKVHAIECALFIALGMHHGELGRIKEPAAVQPVDRDKVPPLLTS